MNFLIDLSNGFKQGIVHPGVLMVYVSSSSGRVDRSRGLGVHVGDSSLRKFVELVLLMVKMTKLPPHTTASRNRYLNREGNERDLPVSLAGPMLKQSLAYCR